MTKVYVAFYYGRSEEKGFKGFISRLKDLIIRLATWGKYSHCEIAIPTNIAGLYDCYSASWRDKGVRKKTMHLPLYKWTLLEARSHEYLAGYTDKELLEHVKTFFNKTKGRGYDIMGALGCCLPWLTENQTKYYCSEWCITALDPHPIYVFSVSPNRFFKSFKNPNLY